MKETLIIIRDIGLIIVLVWVLFSFMSKAETGDQVPLTPPESLYTPHGAVQTVK